MARGICAAGLALLLAAAAAADFKRAYLDGVRAAKRGDWPEVVEKMREAIAEEPVARERVRLVGSIPDPYLPHYYLGRAYFETGDCAAAVDEWRTSREQGAIRNQEKLFAELERDLAHCESLTKEPQAPPVEQPPEPEPEEAAPEEEPAPSVPPAPPPTAPPAPPVVPPPSTTTTALSLPPPPPADEEPPAWLVDAAQAYFDGEYQKTLDRLDGAAVPEGRPLFYARLFRAAARHALFLVGGEADAALRDAAVEDVRACLREDPSYRPRLDYFSPRFLALFSGAPAGGR